MGTWGTGLYQSDIAADVRAVYRDCKKLGFSGSERADIVLETVGAPSPGSKDGKLARLALADLLCKDRMLPRALQQAALRIIKSPELPARFDDEASRNKHRKMLDALGAKLGAATPDAAKRKPPYIEQCDFAIGEVLAHPLPKGRWALLRVVAYFARFRGKSPICEVLAWNITAIPPAAKIKGLRFMRQKNIPVLGELKKDEMLSGLMAHKRLPKGATWQDYVDQYTGPYIPVIRLSERDPHFRKVVRTGVNTPSERPFHGDWWVATNAWTTWKDLWMKLEGYFSDKISDPRTR
ncbi:MAG TPA: hypothetical protein VJV39_10285 [Dongiaceae bacterium]|nr:hypothetical protein [Dongiaceae bacterium]